MSAKESGCSLDKAPCNVSSFVRDWHAFHFEYPTQRENQQEFMGISNKRYDRTGP